MKLKKMINASMLVIGMMGALTVTTPASALNFGGLPTLPNLFGIPLSGLTLGGGITFGAPVISVGMDFQGWVTMLTSDGEAYKNSSFSDEPNFHGWRTPIKGHMVMDIGGGGLRGAATFEPFLFNTVLSSGHDVTFYSPNALLNLLPTNTLLLGNMLFDYAAVTKNIPVSIVLDIGDLTTALKNTAKGKVLKGVLTAESDNTLVRDCVTCERYGIPMGPVLVATTSFNTTDIDTNGDGMPGPITNGTNPSGTTPLIVDTAIDATNGDVGIGGSPIKVSLFKTFNPNFDIVTATVTCFNVLASCNTSSLPMPPLPPLSAQPFGPLLKFLPQ